MTNEERKVIELALEALGAYMSATDSEEDAKAHNLMAEAFFKIKEALAQPEQEGGVCGRCGGWVSDPVITQPEQDQDEVDIRSRLYQRIHELETQLAQSEQKPVAWAVIASNTGRICQVELNFAEVEELSPKWVAPLYTTPPQRKPLTHEQRFDLLTKFEPYKNKWGAPAILIDMVEAAHGIKE